MAVLGAGLALATPVSGQPPETLRDARQTELEAVVRDIAVTEERLEELRREIASLDENRAALNRALIDTNRRVQALEGRITDTERRIAALGREEEGLRASLLAQRDVLAEVLAALQRMRRRPPPAIVVRPEDALAAVRSAILLGAVVPDLRLAAEKVALDLKQLVALKEETAREHDRLTADAAELAEERARTALLLEEKREEIAASASELRNEEERAAELAEQAGTLKDLIARMESEIAAAAEAKVEAERAAARNREAAKDGGAIPASLGATDRLAPAVSFDRALGLLPKPVHGDQVLSFGETDDLGARAEGISISTRPGAQVSSPADGWVVYAGPFRSYGQLLIINAGDGYHVLLAGMDQTNVQLGQFVLAGEPVATMASPKIASAGGLDMVSTHPVLYIEFRKDGTSIDPAPWWAATGNEKVGG